MCILKTRGGNLYLCKDKDCFIHQCSLLMHAGVSFKVYSIHEFVFIE